MKRSSKLWLIIVVFLTLFLPGLADTPKLHIRMKNGTPIEERKKEQIERLARQYDLKKWTITRDILIEQGVRPHSFPVLTLNGRWPDEDDLALSVYLHEQAHWVLMERHRGQMIDLYQDLKRLITGLPIEFPQGSGEEHDTYIHLAVIILEWQSLKDLFGAERARKVMDFKKTDHYTAIYPAVLEHQKNLQKILNRYSIRW